MIVLCFDSSYFRLIVAAVVLIHRWVLKVVPAHAPRIAAPEACCGLTRKLLGGMIMVMLLPMLVVMVGVITMTKRVLKTMVTRSSSV